jgi:hypothetical protein
MLMLTYLLCLYQGLESLAATRAQEKEGPLPDDVADGFDLEGLTSQLQSMRGRKRVDRAPMHPFKPLPKHSLTVFTRPL